MIGGTDDEHGPASHVVVTSMPHARRLSQRSAATPARKVVMVEGTEFVIDPRYEVTR